MNVNTAMSPLVQIIDAVRAAFAQHVSERADVGRTPARSMRHNNVGDIENLLPAMSVGRHDGSILRNIVTPQ